MNNNMNELAYKVWQLRMIEEESELRKKLMSLTGMMMRPKDEIMAELAMDSVMVEAYYRSIKAKKRHMESYLNDLVFQISLWKVNN